MTYSGCANAERHHHFLIFLSKVGMGVAVNGYRLCLVQVRGYGQGAGKLPRDRVRPISLVCFDKIFTLFLVGYRVRDDIVRHILWNSGRSSRNRTVFPGSGQLSALSGSPVTGSRPVSPTVAEILPLTRCSCAATGNLVIVRDIPKLAGFAAYAVRNQQEAGAVYGRAGRRGVFSPTS